MYPNEHEVSFPRSSLPPLALLLISLGERRHHVKDSGHFVWRHLAVLHAADLATFSESLQANREFPALAFVNEEHILLTIGIADAGAEDVQMFGRL